MKLYKMAYGDHITEEMAVEIVNNMKPIGMRWNINETEQIQRDYGYDGIDPIDFFLVMNQAANDFRDVFGDNLETYIRYTKAFICDEDARKDKVTTYFLVIPK